MTTVQVVETSDPDLRIRGGPQSQKNPFWPFGPHFGLKIWEGVGRGPLGPSPGSATVFRTILTNRS